MKNERNLAIIALLVTMLFWGSAAVFMRTLGLALSPENSLALRYVLVTIINVAGLWWLGTWRIRREHWLRFLVVGVIGMGGFNWFINAGFTLVPAGVGTIITMIEPIMIAILAFFVLREKLTADIFAGLAIASLGAVVLFWQDLTSVSGSAVSLKGIVYLLIGCLCWAIYTVLAKPLLEVYDSFTVTAVTMLIAAPLLIGAATEPLGELALRLDARQWAELVYLTLASGILGTLLWNYGAKRMTSAVTGSFLYLIPVVAVICGALILDEEVTVYIVAGGLLMLAGVAIAQFGPSLRRAVVT